ncbi:MAG: hypothetical protein RR370_03765, partial [Synergistaceae bacterium]
DGLYSGGKGRSGVIGGDIMFGMKKLRKGLPAMLDLFILPRFLILPILTERVPGKYDINSNTGLSQNTLLQERDEPELL